METIKWAVNEMPKTDDSQLQVMSLENVAKARAFHESFPQYSVTPLVKLDHMATYLGLKEVYVKDESYRFGLNAFKVLGGSFAMARYIAKQTGKDVSELPYNVLTSDEQAWTEICSTYAEGIHSDKTEQHPERRSESYDRRGKLRRMCSYG